MLLTGAFAYKLKKPLDLGFLDFTTLEKRRIFCEEEVRLNRRTAPSIYLDVVPVAGALEQPSIGASGPVLDYAVRMREFAPDQTFDALLVRGELEAGRIDDLAASVAAFHAKIAVADPASRSGSPDLAWKAADENFRQVEPLVEDGPWREALRRLRGWSQSEFTRVRPLLEARRTSGFVRECHGDLHLGNYLGAIKRFVPLQKTHHCLYCVVDMHAITVWQDPSALPDHTREVTAAFIACGSDLYLARMRLVM